MIAIKLFKYIPKENVEYGSVLKISEILERRILPKFVTTKLIKYRLNNSYERWLNCQRPFPFNNIDFSKKIWYRTELIYSYDLYKEIEIRGKEPIFSENIPKDLKDELYANDICQEEDVYLLTKYINPDIKEQFMKEIYPFFKEGETFILIYYWG